MARAAWRPSRKPQLASDHPSQPPCSCQTTIRVHTPRHCQSLGQRGAPEKNFWSHWETDFYGSGFSLDPENPSAQTAFVANILHKWQDSREVQENRRKHTEQAAPTEGRWDQERGKPSPPTAMLRRPSVPGSPSLEKPKFAESRPKAPTANRITHVLPTIPSPTSFQLNGSFTEMAASQWVYYSPLPYPLPYPLPHPLPFFHRIVSSTGWLGLGGTLTVRFHKQSPLSRPLTSEQALWRMNCSSSGPSVSYPLRKQTRHPESKAETAQKRHGPQPHLLAKWQHGLAPLRHPLSFPHFSPTSQARDLWNTLFWELLTFLEKLYILTRF